MTNEEILASWDYGIELDEDFHRILNLARQDEREKMQTEIGHLEYKIEGLQQALSRNKDEREKMQGVEVFISWDSEDAEFEPQENPCSVWADRPEYDREFGTFDESKDVAWLFNVPEEFCDMIGVDSGQCKKFRIVEDLT